MSAVPQIRNVSLGGVGAWLSRAETLYIEALNSHAGRVILRHVLRPFRLFAWRVLPVLRSIHHNAAHWARSASLAFPRAVFLGLFTKAKL